MLANDSNEGKNQSEFFLVIRPHQTVAELMAECPSCGAKTSFALRTSLAVRRCPAASATGPCDLMKTTWTASAKVQPMRWPEWTLCSGVHRPT